MVRRIARTLGATTLGVTALVLSLLVAISSTADAHSTLATAAPGPGDEVGGTVEHLDLVFAAGLSDATVTLTDPEGTLVDGTTSQSQNNRLRFDTDPLTVEGQYVVRYAFDSADGDSTRSAYAFSYQADAPGPQVIGPVDPILEPVLEPDQTTTVSPVKYVGLGAMAIALVGAAALAWSRRPERNA